MEGSALLVVDVQNDFCPGGALPVRHGNKVVKTLNDYVKYFYQNGLPVFASRDWHPETTTHFKKYGGIWPAHCVQNTHGARFHPQLRLPRSAVVLSKGMHPKKDNYSAFQAVDSQKRPFPKILNKMKIMDLYVGGLAADYCVKSSVLDALKSGLTVYLLADAIRGVNLKKDDSKKAIVEMLRKGAQKITFRQFKKEISQSCCSCCCCG